MVRVNDVELADQRTNGNTELRVTQVDVGLPGAFRRLLQGVVPPMAIRRMQEKLPQRTIRGSLSTWSSPIRFAASSFASPARILPSSIPPIWPT